MLTLQEQDHIITALQIATLFKAGLVDTPNDQLHTTRGHPLSAGCPLWVALDQLGFVSMVASRLLLLSRACRKATYTSWAVTAVFFPVPRVISTPSKACP